MFQPNHQHLISPRALSTRESSALNPVDRNDPFGIVESETQREEFRKVEFIKLQDELQNLGLRIKHHEENLKFLKNCKNRLEESIFDIQVTRGKYHSSEVKNENENNNHFQTEEDTVEQILRHEKSAAAILYQLKTRHGTQAPNLALTKDVLGIVATLGKVDNDNLSRILSEYLGLETMLAIVCKTYEGVKALELYDREGRINNCTGLHGLGSTIGRPVDGRFLVICLENLRPYAGEFVADDPQRKISLLKPRLPNGDCPAGFVGFAVNMIILDSANLFFLTGSGHGLRETLFYSLFSRLQVYRTRAEMLLAVPCINDGAVSLDGGIIRSNGIFYLGSRKDTEVRFPIDSGTTNLPPDYIQAEENMKKMNWEKERLLEDMQREQALMNHVKGKYDSKKQEFVKFIAQGSHGPFQFIPLKL
ncbi:protein DEFECTIVE IN MERISTEM SILENCING 3-like isoform X2 [Macadamia integrifolia]|uniref:protein DEFECTIVE IN MERISTEM SILENCING 3-like isoform X2 n=1 Tax=Macadamia integrifolia TaxID=60698 RepID=UPI001C4FC9CC|nr:protein DEFECTIVE IN MERISTEM SILENCING 3-like isoform X2 [Macadamia integrifolia]